MRDFRARICVWKFGQNWAIFWTYYLIHRIIALIALWEGLPRGVLTFFNNSKRAVLIMKNEEEKSPFSHTLDEVENGLGFESFHSKMERNGAKKKRALDLSKYITNCKTGKGRKGAKTLEESKNIKIANKLGSCASYLIFKNYYQRDEIRLHSADLCKIHLLCPFCAARRAVKYLQAYMAKVEHVTAENPRLRAFFVTVTIKDRADLSDAFQHIRNAMRKMMKQRSNALRGQKHVEFAKALGGVHSIEVKRGSGSGLWHPHVHMIWLCEDIPDSEKLSQQWFALTGDSYIVDIRECYGDSMVEAFLEVFKYALKFSDMSFSDNWEAYQTLKGKRLIDSFGCLKGIEVSENLLDDEIENEPYLLMLYRFFYGSGYNFIGQGDETDIHEMF